MVGCLAVTSLLATPLYAEISRPLDRLSSYDVFAQATDADGQAKKAETPKKANQEKKKASEKKKTGKSHVSGAPTVGGKNALHVSGGKSESAGHISGK